MRQLITFYHPCRFPYIRLSKRDHYYLSRILHQGTIRKIPAIANGSSHGFGSPRSLFIAPPPPSSQAPACKGATNRTKEPRAIIQRGFRARRPLSSVIFHPRFSPSILSLSLSFTLFLSFAPGFPFPLSLCMNLTVSLRSQPPYTFYNGIGAIFIPS